MKKYCIDFSKRTKDIFISSTYDDLVDYRRAVWGALKKYDVNIRGMEAFGARKESPLETCLSELELSDIYVGIIGMRFGSVEEMSQKSYTQLEYEKAIELGKEILIYIISENALVPVRYVDMNEKAMSLSKFKNHLKSKHTVDLFNDENDLCVKLCNRFDDILEIKNEKEDKFVENYVQKTLEAFNLMPKAFVGNELQITVNIKKDPYLISKELCSSLGLTFGESIGVPVSLIKPFVKLEHVEDLIIQKKDLDFYLNCEAKRDYTITVELLFIASSPKSKKSVFSNEYETKKIANPFYKPNPLKFTSLGSQSADYDDQKYIVESKTIVGDGFCALLLTDYYYK